MSDNFDDKFPPPTKDELGILNNTDQTKQAPVEDFDDKFPPPSDAEKQQMSSTSDKFISGAKSAVAGAAQGATMGWLDEGMALAKSGMDAIADKLGDKADTPAFQQRYQENLQKVRDKLKELHDNNPTAFTTGEIAGTVGSLFVPGGMITKGLEGVVGTGTAAKLASAAATGAIEGGVQGAGYSEGKSLKDTLKDTASGAELGAAGGAIGSAAGTIGGKALNWIGKNLDNVELASLGVRAGKGVDQEEIAKVARESGILTSNSKATAANAAALRDAAAENLTQFTNKVKQLNPDAEFIDKDSLVKSLTEEIAPHYSRGGTPEAKQAVAQWVEEIQNTDPTNFKEIRDLKSKIGNATTEAESKQKSVREVAKQIYGKLAEQVNQGLESVGNQLDNPDLANQFQQANKQYRIASVLADSTKKVADSGGKSLFDIIKHPVARTAAVAGLGGAGVYTASHGDIHGAEGAAAAGLLLLGKKYGPAMASAGRNLLAAGADTPAAQALTQSLLQGDMGAALNVIHKQTQKAKQTEDFNTVSKAVQGPEDSDKSKQQTTSLLNYLKQP